MFDNQTVLVIGSSTGIGLACAQLIKQYGGTPILHGRTESDSLKQEAKKLNASYIVCDVADKVATTQAIETIFTADKKIDALINCAGVPKVVPFLESTDEDWLTVYKINVLGMVHTCQAIIPHMLSQGTGRIVNIASVRAHEHGVSHFNMPYGVSKAAVKNITAALAKEFAPTLSVNSVSPGPVETSFSKTWSKTMWQAIENSLLGRVGQPMEVAELIVWLASTKASFVTGQDFIVDGGLLMSTIK